jgi:glycosyltransferase involved in cell wall biosynthesis
VLEARAALHHRLSHALSGISRGALHCAEALHLCAAAPLPCAGSARDGGHGIGARELAGHGFANLAPWGRGVDPSLFDPELRDERPEFERPIFLYVGRITHEKNLPAFLGLDLPGSKVVVGEGPALAAMKTRYPDVHFLGKREGCALAKAYATADVFVFPSRTGTFGLVILEALVSGVPVAAYRCLDRSTCSPAPTRGRSTKICRSRR